MLDGVDTRREKSRRNRPDLAAHVLMHQLRRQRMQVNDAIHAIVILLERDEFADRAEVIAKMEIAGGLNAGKNQRLKFAHD
ncbi:hypothetical protein RvVAT039_20010 [Agrobacterium vitis]|nr:hypothetical protein RvVAT039_20010 [Agrobacterium vitis]